MSNSGTVEEREAEYHKRFNRVGDHLRDTAYRLKAGLLSHDITGILFGVGIEFLREHEPDNDAVRVLAA